MADEAFQKIVTYGCNVPPGGAPDWVRAELRPLVQGLFDEVAGEIAAHWGPTDVNAEGLAFALGYLHTRYGGTE
jgi:hypothetical protein